ncbi:bifunctional folylpolyglutamate synthase/dihydrofolate synthase [Dyadobacter tibetensis]|uniref:bifunctional folylpolyglutamate synthase/dihydrofolate synthase n=1 Tax=Dyadobacter tibetensis TaxID=1211851 RepID=UPI00046ED0BA|nr:folylpolyglutamate synthase/dihydrofolate synthase family protein [Dyadobacter tibetensis]
MQYQEAVDYLYSRLPVFQNIGAKAFKPGLQTTKALCEILGNPQDLFPVIHVGGTNGKGSSSHMLASIFQEAGYKVGLYTSPHLKSFTERIRVQGQPIREDYVGQFVSDNLLNIERLSPSFFELTVGMAFRYFADQNVDIAIIEVGMGGRLDSTNVVQPLVSLITNVSFDHVQYLGDTLAKIAFEKAGIIKAGIPVIIGEYDPNTAPVFEEISGPLQSPLYFADKLVAIDSRPGDAHTQACKVIASTHFSDLNGAYRLDLLGEYQLKNLKGVLIAVSILKDLGFNLSLEIVQRALAKVKVNTGLKGRWQQISERPNVFCDTGHNYAGLTLSLHQFSKIKASQHRFVIGFVSDKDIDGVLTLFPTGGKYYFCQPANSRALDAATLKKMAQVHGLYGDVFWDVNTALKKAREESAETDAIYVGGSTFVVADLVEL